MNPGLKKLHSYPFEKMAEMTKGISNPPERELINLSIGEPKLQTPRIVTDNLVAHLNTSSKYPTTRGLPELRNAIGSWATQRFKLDVGQLNPTSQILPVNGTREALFAIANTLLDKTSKKNLVGLPNPFYQIYEGATLLAGGVPFFFNCPESQSFIPQTKEVPDEVWREIAFVYICSPGNPSGSVMTHNDYSRLFKLAEKFDFHIVADECYSELYDGSKPPPLGLLEWCNMEGNKSFYRCLVMHSLSKRSNCPGLRSGFVAGDVNLINHFYRYRTYQGGAMPLYTQHASIAAWSDEQHVVRNREFYRKNFTSVSKILRKKLDVTIPDAGFYLWLKVPSDDILLCKKLLKEEGVLLLPGQFLSRTIENFNPGTNRVRIALVESEKTCIEAAKRILRII